jgi:peptide/nickel transport system ATP-binding protein
MSATQVSAEVLPAAAARGALVLEAHTLSKDFRLSRGLHGEVLSAARAVSFGLYRSAVVALVGESGSGKSTVARMLAGQEQPTGGEILLDGAAVRPWARSTFRSYKSEVQMVFQDPFASLNSVHTVRYALRRPVRLHQRAKGKAAVAAELERLLERVRLTPPEQFLAKYPHELSGGQRQRVAIARALAARPRVLLADEPVSMLDVSIRLEMLDLIDELRSQFELAVLYVTHDIASARYFADDTLVMYAGEIVERGPSEDVTQRPAHPYTQLLVASSPDPDNLDKLLEPAAAGQVRRAGSALATTVGCRFSARCPLAQERCRAQSPPLLPINSQRAAACWRLDVAAPELLSLSDAAAERNAPMNS